MPRKMAEVLPDASGKAGPVDDARVCEAART